MLALFASKVIILIADSMNPRQLESRLKPEFIFHKYFQIVYRKRCFIFQALFTENFITFEFNFDCKLYHFRRTFCLKHRVLKKNARLIAEFCTRKITIFHPGHFLFSFQRRIRWCHWKVWIRSLDGRKSGKCVLPFFVLANCISPRMNIKRKVLVLIGECVESGT